MSAVTVVATLAAGAAIQAVADRAVPAMWRKTKSRRTARHEQRERQAGNRPDHETIRSGSLAGIGMLGSGPEIRVVVACAPATDQPPAELTLPTVQSFVDATFPHVVTPGTPPIHGVQRDGFDFEGTRIELGPVPMVRIQQNGLVEAAVSIPFVDLGEQRCSIRLDDVVRVVQPLLSAVKSGRYRGLFGMAASERLDWVVRVGDAVTVGGNWLALREYHFDGPAPAAGPHARRIGFEGAGIARKALEARDQATEPRELLEAVLTEMLSLGGYEGYEPTLTYLLAYV